MLLGAADPNRVTTAAAGEGDAERSDPAGRLAAAAPPGARTDRLHGAMTASILGAGE